MAETPPVAMRLTSGSPPPAGLVLLVLGAAAAVAALQILRRLRRVERTQTTEIALATLVASAASKYNSENEGHEQLLEDLWSAMRPGEQRSGRISSDWSRIGFQGEDPATDFRGMGLLGLRALLHVAREHRVLTQGLLARTADDPMSYPVAVAGINLTADVLRLLRGNARLANAVFATPDTEAHAAFGDALARFWAAFDAYHKAAVLRFLEGGGAPELAVMQFNQMRAAFLQRAEADPDSWYPIP